MDENGYEPVLVRLYEVSDRTQIESFTCHRNYSKWSFAAQRVIQLAPSELATENLEMLVCSQAGSVIAVAVYKVHSEVRCEILAIGVLTHRQNQGVGQNLKSVLMAEVSTRHPTCRYVSSVHRRNDPMLHINRKLLAETAPNPEDPEYLLTVVGADVTP